MTRRPLLRPALVWLLAGPAMALAVLLAALLSLFRGQRRGFWAVAPGYIRLMAWGFGIRRELEGWAALPEDIRDGAPVIFFANHTSLLDPPLLISTLPDRPVFIAKQELGRVPVLGWAIRLAGFILIDRGHQRKAYASLQDAAVRIRAGQSVAIFPEGTRSRDGALLPFKRGGFHLAMEAGVPLVPLAIRGGHGILPKGSWRTRGGPYALRVGEPIDPRSFGDAESLRTVAEARLRAMLADQPS
ncbi:MAG TPA: lysophospholipid acyltransferase family protein [Holophagaceae bacterium]|nr:lysophospholipid acyltransferase family protein [Holophagaceae bacterium]